MDPDRRTARIGTLYCLAAAIGYTLVNTGQRFLSVEFDQIWVNAIRETTAMLFLAPMVLLEARKGHLSWGRSFRVWGVLALGALVIHLFGNIPSLWALSQIGLVVTVPIYLGVNLVFSAILGWLFLKQSVSFTSLVAIGLLIVAVLFLQSGAEAVHESIAGSASAESVDSAAISMEGQEVVLREEPETSSTHSSAFWAALAVGAACLAGLAFSQLGVAMSYAINHGVSIGAVAWTVPVVGTLVFLPWKLLTTDFSAIPTVDPDTRNRLILVMGAVCVANAISFFLLTKGFQMVTVVHVNVVGASQVAFGAIFGMVLFHEPASLGVVFGVVLTIVGMILISRRPPKREKVGGNVSSQ